MKERLRRRDRPGHRVVTLPGFRPIGADRLGRPEGARAHLSAAGLGRARSPRRSGATSTRSCRRRSTSAQLDALRPRRARHRQPARDDGPVGPRDRQAGAQRDQLAGHAHRPARARARRATSARTASASSADCRWRRTSPARRSAGCWTPCPGCASAREAGEVLFGTMDSWLIWNLTGRHLTDVTNASRTMLMSLHTLDWDDELLGALGVPRAMLPEIRASSRDLRRGARAAGGRAGGLGARRPAGGAVRADVLRGRRGEVHVRDRQLPAVQHGRPHRPVGQRPLTTVGCRIGERAADLCAGGLDRGDRRARAVVPRQHHADRLGARDRDARAHGRGQRRLLLRARVLGAVRAALAQRRARRHRRPHRLHHQGPPRARGPRGDRMADARGRRGDERRRRDAARARCASTAA